jgi:hypothetical protein
LIGLPGELRIIPIETGWHFGSSNSRKQNNEADGLRVCSVGCRCEVGTVSPPRRPCRVDEREQLHTGIFRPCISTLVGEFWLLRAQDWITPDVTIKRARRDRRCLCRAVECCPYGARKSSRRCRATGVWCCVALRPPTIEAGPICQFLLGQFKQALDGFPGRTRSDVGSSVLARFGISRIMHSRFN